MASTVRVSAIVSAYKAARLIRRRLDNLLDTDMAKRGELEIIVVNAGNKQDEHDIILGYLDCPYIKYIRTLREPIYTSWNRAIKLSTAPYLTNANCDDLLFKDTLDRLAQILDENEEIGVAYPDMVAASEIIDIHHYVPTTDGPYVGDFSWPDFDPLLMTKFCYTGPMPMWRTRLHTECGLFDESYQLAGDYEFFLRLATFGIQFEHARFKAGLFYEGGSGTTNPQISGHEARRAILLWRDEIYERLDHSHQS